MLACNVAAGTTAFTRNWVALATSVAAGTVALTVSELGLDAVTTQSTDTSNSALPLKTPGGTGSAYPVENTSSS